MGRFSGFVVRVFIAVGMVRGCRVKGIFVLRGLSRGSVLVRVVGVVDGFHIVRGLVNGLRSIVPWSGVCASRGDWGWGLGVVYCEWERWGVVVWRQVWCG